ncbi:MAG: carbon-nitrogen hydrolase family protein [Archangiaceae bacterium]|nr:carbon-nitrogen hydrolase family protein [Archangiaceae bacterium]
MCAPMAHLAAAIQLTSGADKAKNVETATALVRAAAKAGAVFIGLPENFAWMGPEPERATAAEALDGPTSKHLATLARELKITLLAGSVLETGAPGGRLYNTSCLFGPDGERTAVYRKMHLFDVEVGDGQTYRESAAVAPGEAPVLVDTSIGKVGLSVCYDLRFPELYRAYSSKGATVLTVPAAFTLMTGKDHWEVLLRARAIENLCHVIAPAQVGLHPKDRRTFGNAMIIDPWGAVISRCSDGEGFTVAPIDAELTARLRKGLPSLQHRRLT